MEHYLHVFWESIWVASVLPFSAEPSFFAMLYFGGFNMWLAAACAIAGSIIGMTLNWHIGKALYRLHQKKKTFNISEYWYERCAVMFTKYGAFLLILSWMPIVKFVVLIAGFLNKPYRFVMPLVIIGHVLVYTYYVVKPH